MWVRHRCEWEFEFRKDQHLSLRPPTQVHSTLTLTSTPTPSHSSFSRTVNCRRSTIDHDYCIENCLKPVAKEMWKQRKSSGTKGIKLLHDNARPHTHSDVINYLTEEGIDIMPHSPYSPDLAPCDYWLNDYIKRNLADQTNEKSLAHAVSKIVKNIPEEEFKKTFDKLLERMELCINNHGDYFEHLMK